jgi:hypothetical protein
VVLRYAITAGTNIFARIVVVQESVSMASKNNVVKTVVVQGFASMVFKNIIAVFVDTNAYPVTSTLSTKKDLHVDIVSQ